MIRRIKRVKPKKRFYPAKVQADPVKTGDEREFLFEPPLPPHKKLLIWTSIVFGLWVIGLILMYALTVYPLRHHHGASPPPTQPSAPATQTAPGIPLPPPIPVTPKVPQATTQPSDA